MRDSLAAAEPLLYQFEFGQGPFISICSGARRACHDAAAQKLAMHGTTHLSARADVADQELLIEIAGRQPGAPGNPPNRCAFQSPFGAESVGEPSYKLKGE